MLYVLESSTVTQWIEGLREGRESAAAKLWDHFLERLTKLVCNRLKTVSQAVSDEEDVVLDACDACFRALRENRYPNIANRNDLWKLLAVIAERKAIDQIRRSKKGIDGIRADVSFKKISVNSSIVDGTQLLPCTEPTPEFAAVFAENLKRQIGQLDELHAQVALLKLQGFTSREIGKQIGRSIPSVERYMKFIRTAWAYEPDESN